MAILHLGFPVSRVQGKFAGAYYTRLGKSQVLKSISAPTVPSFHLPTPPQKPDCRAFFIADLRAQRMPAAERALWRAALKRSRASWYTLWMKESIACLLRHSAWPVGPSISGGFSLGKIRPGPVIDIWSKEWDK